MKFNRMICACLAALLLMLAASPAMAKVVSPGDEFYYLDAANVLTEATEGEIFFSNELLNEACGAQIAVVTLDSTGSVAIDDYAYELINDWGIGDKSRNNGFLLLLAIEDDDYYAVCGAGILPKLTSGTLKRYFDDYLEADFAAKRYDAGVKKFFEAIFAYIAEIYNADVTTAQGIAAYNAWIAEAEAEPLTGSGSGGSATDSYARDDDGGMLGMILLFLIVLFVIILIARNSRRRTYTTGGVHIFPIFFGGSRRAAPPPPPRGPFGSGPQAGRGGQRGNVGGWTSGPSGGLFGGSGASRPSSGSGLFGGSSRSSGTSRPSSGSGLFGGSSRSSGSLFGGFGRSSGGRSSFGSARGGGGGSRGGGAGRGRH